jgi:hypothetical protein
MTRKREVTPIETQPIHRQIEAATPIATIMSNPSKAAPQPQTLQGLLHGPSVSPMRDRSSASRCSISALRTATEVSSEAASFNSWRDSASFPNIWSFGFSVMVGSLSWRDDEVAARLFSLIWGAAGDDGDPTWKERGRQLRPPLSSSVTSCRAPRYAPELPLRRDIERGRRARARCVHGGRPSRGARNRGVCQLLCGVEQHVWRVLLPSCGARLLSWTWRVSSVWLPVGRPYSPGNNETRVSAKRSFVTSTRCR